MKLDKVLRGAMAAFIALSSFSPLASPFVPAAEAAKPGPHRPAPRKAVHVTKHKDGGKVRFNDSARGRTQGVEETTARLQSFNAFETSVINALGLNPLDVQSISFNNSDPSSYGVISTSNAAGFPLQGSDFFAMSTGQLSSWDDPNVPDTTGFLSATALRSPGTDDLSFALGNCANVPGGTISSCGPYEGVNQDMSRMTLTLVPPTGYTSLTFSYKFLSEEYPDFVGSSYNDSFIVEKGSSTFFVDDALTFQAMGNNIAVDGSNRPINVSSNFFSSGDPASNASGTTYNGASGVLSTTVAGLTSGQPVTLVFSVLDVADSQLDSAVFLDKFQWGGLTQSGTGEGTPPTYTPPSAQTSVCGTSSPFNLGSFLDGDGSPWTFTVNWGDSSTSSGTVNAQGGLGSFNHTYGSSGTHTVTVTVTDSTNQSASGTFTVTVNCNFNLTTSANPAAGGTVSPASGPVLVGTTVNVTQTANPGWTFSNWSGACSGSGACAVTVNADTSVVANYTQNVYSVIVNVTGDGWANGAGTNYHYGDSVTINGGPFPGSSLSSVSGAGCSTLPCTFTVTGNAIVDVVYTRDSYLLTTSANPAAGGVVVPVTGTVLSNSVVSVSQVPNPGYTFNGWTGDCTGNDPCTVTMTGPKTVTANYTQNTYSVVVNITGNGWANGDGTNYHYGDTATINGGPFPGWSLGSVSGAGCSTLPCNITIDGNKVVNVVYTRDSYTLTTVANPAAGGSVSGGGSYLSGFSANVTQTPNAGYTFTGWSGACTGTGTCIVSMDGPKTVTANYAAIPNYTVTTSADPAAGGTVNGGGSYQSGSSVTVSQTPNTGFTFAGWTSTPAGVCTSGGDCTFTVTGNTTVTANYTRNQYTVTVNVTGNGTGTGGGTYYYGDNPVVGGSAASGWTLSSVSGGGCSSLPCTLTVTGNVTVNITYSSLPSFVVTTVADPAVGGSVLGGGTYLVNTSVTLTQTPASGYKFAGWTTTPSGLCTGTGASGLGDCTLAVTGNTTVTAHFVLPQVFTSVQPTSAGTVTGAGSYPIGTPVTLVATPASGYAFSSWSGTPAGLCPGTGTGSTCSFNMPITGASVIAHFVQTYTVSANVSPLGAGTVSGTGTFPDGTPFELTQTPNPGYTFTGWTGDCTGMTCSNTVFHSNFNATANYTLNQYTLTTNAAPAAGGSVSPATGLVNAGTQVTVIQSANPNYTFNGWTGACTGTGSCVVTVNADTTVTANYSLNQYMLTTNASPAAGGSVNPATGPVNAGTQVTVTQTPASGYAFTGWSGACSGTGACVVTVNANTTVTANYSLIQYTLTTNANPAAGGLVTSAGTYPQGATVNVTYAANAGYVFNGWSGGCSGMGSCVVTLLGNVTVTANFVLADQTKPVITGSGKKADNSPYTPGTWSNQDVTVTFTCQDEPGGSGIATNTVAGQTVSVSTASVTNTGTCVDNAGNVADPATYGPIKIDKIKPVVSVTATVGGNPYTPGTPTQGPVVVTFTCTDEVGGSGVLGTPVSTTNVTSSGTVTSPACVDNATNVGDPVSFGPIVIDNTPPTVTGVDIIVPATDANGTNVTTYTVTVTDNQTPNLTATCAPAAPHLFAIGGPYTVTCTATDAAGNTGTGTFTVTVTPPSYTLTTVANPTAGGTVSSGGSFPLNTQVTVTATPNAGFTFTGFTGGGCGATSPCTVTVTGNVTVTANFAAIPNYTLTTAASPAAGGTVTGGGSYAQGTVVSVTQSPNNGYAFAGWTGACTGTGACSVTMDAAKTVTATYNQLSYTVTTNVTGSGTVTGAGTSYHYGDSVTVTATPASGWSLSVISGDCTVSPCTLTINGNKTVNVTFTQNATPDTTPPTVTGQNIVVTATSPAGYNVTAYNVTVNDNVSSGLVATCTPAVPHLYPIGGPYTVNCTATDGAGNTGSGSFTVTVLPLPTGGCQPELFNVFDPGTKKVVVYASGNCPGVTSGPVTGTKISSGNGAAWGNDDDCDDDHSWHDSKSWRDSHDRDDDGNWKRKDDDKKRSSGVTLLSSNDDDRDHERNDDRDEDGNHPNVEVWSYTVTSSNGSTTTMTEKVKFTKSEIKVRMLTVKYNNGSVQTLPPNSKHYEWSLNSNGSIKEFEEKMTVQRGQNRESVSGKYSSRTGSTKLYSAGRNPQINETRNGLVIVTLGTNNGGLVIAIGNTVVTTPAPAPDTTKPTITATAKKADGSAYTAGSWTNQNVTVVFTCADNAGGSGIAQDTVPDVTVTATTALVTSTGTCRDNAGNVADAASFGPIKIDKVKPVITVTAKTLNGQTYVAGTTTTSRVKLTYTCSDENGGSGIALDTVRDKYATYSHTSVVSSGTCRDAAGNTADPVSFGPIKIAKSNHSDDNDDDCDRD